MNLIIDVGNTFVKLALFSASKLVNKKIVKLNNIVKEIGELQDAYTIKNAIISSVGKLQREQLIKVSNAFNTIILSASTKLPFINLYATPNTLGVDRLALVSSSVRQFSRSNVLIIDAGTCITYDFINANNEYLGGAISPGISMRYKALNNLTANLPLLHVDVPESIIGNSTEQSIHSGVVLGVINEIEGAIKTYRLKYSDLTVILTGGDAKFLSKQLKSIIFAHPNFLLEGLNYILQLNVNE